MVLLQPLTLPQALSLINKPIIVFSPFSGQGGRAGSLGSRSLSKEADPEAVGGPCLIVIQSTESRIFGSFLTAYPRLTDNFVGTGKSWLFAFGSLYSLLIRKV